MSWMMVIYWQGNQDLDLKVVALAKVHITPSKGKVSNKVHMAELGFELR